MSKHTYSQTAGDETASYFQNVAISPATVKDGTLLHVLDTHLYPQVGVFFDEDRALPTVALVTSSATPPTSMAFTLTATVTYPGHKEADLITFKSGVTTIGTAETDVNGVATLIVTAGLTAGAHTVTAVAPDGKASSGVTVTPANPTVALATSNASPVHATAFDLTATVTYPDTAYVGTGNVVFKDGATTIGTVAISNAAHIATAVLHVTAGVTAGAHTMTAVFDGVTSSGVVVTAS